MFAEAGVETMNREQIRSLFDLSGRVALVTGGCRGLGLAMSQGLAAAGVKLACIGSRPDGGELRRQMGDCGEEFTYIQADLADRRQRDGLVDRVVERFGRLDILVNCAGIQHRQPAVEFDLTRWDTILSLMLTAVFELSQQAAKVMERQGGGKIINIASVCSFQGGWTIPAYTAAKHGVAGLTKALANEWATKNIHVNAIAPGYFDTEMCEAIVNDPVREPQIRSRIPADRWGQPQDLVGPLLFLASDASNYVDGHLLVVDGGWMGR
jgi:2-dehydro-3-deoxy-D-gluconate 5-dehydrogenase